MYKKLLFFVFVFVLATAPMLGVAQAQDDFPNRPVEFVVPWPPGDLEDVLTRLIADEFQSQTGVPAAVVNVPGGGGVIGATEVFQSDPDGHTVGSFVIGIPTAQVQNGNTPYDREEFEPIGIFLTYPFVIATTADAPYNNMAELAEYSQSNDVSLGHFGFGLTPTRATILSMEDLGGAFASEAAFDALDCSTLASGDVDVINTTIQLVLPCLDEVKVLANLGGERLSLTPDVPTLAEQGGIDVSLWNGLFVRKDTPQAARDVIAAAAVAALESDAALELAETTGASVYWETGAAAQARVDADWHTNAAMSARLEGEMMEEASDYPSRPVQFVVPWPPGDLEDVLTRLIADEFQSQTGVPAAVVNVPGGGGVVGATEVFQADADGHTIGSFVIGIPTVQVQGGNTPYDREEFEPVGIFLTYPFVIVAAADAPYNNMAELAEYSQGNDVSLGHFGFGLTPTRATILSVEDLGGTFASEAAFDALDCSTLASGDVDVMNTTIQLVLPCLDEVKVLANIGSERLSLTPDVPTLAEQGGIDVSLWNGLFVRKDTPQAVRDVIEAAAVAALESEEAQELSETTGASVYWLSGAEAQAQVDRDWHTSDEMVTRMGE